MNFLNYLKAYNVFKLLILFINDLKLGCVVVFKEFQGLIVVLSI